MCLGERGGLAELIERSELMILLAEPVSAMEHCLFEILQQMESTSEVEGYLSREQVRLRLEQHAKLDGFQCAPLDAFDLNIYMSKPTRALCALGSPQASLVRSGPRISQARLTELPTPRQRATTGFAPVVSVTQTRACVSRTHRNLSHRDSIPARQFCDLCDEYERNMQPVHACAAAATPVKGSLLLSTPELEFEPDESAQMLTLTNLCDESVVFKIKPNSPDPGGFSRLLASEYATRCACACMNACNFIQWFDRFLGDSVLLCPSGHAPPLAASAVGLCGRVHRKARGCSLGCYTPRELRPGPPGLKSAGRIET